MSQREFFTIGMKLIGLYCLGLGIEEWFKRSSIALAYMSPLIQTDVSIVRSQWLSLVTPVVLAIVGLYLIKDGSSLRDLANREIDGGEPISTRNLFATGIKLYGAFVVVGAISGCLGVVLNLIIVFFAPSYSDSEIILDRIKSNTLPSLLALSLGICCFVNANLFARLSVSRDPTGLQQK